MEAENLILKKIQINKGYITSKELSKMNINRFYISKLEKEGKLEKIKRGLYRDTNKIVENEIFELNKILPLGVLCLESAAEYYGLTMVIPNKYKLAIKRNTRITLPEYPPIKIYYYSEKNYKLGIAEIEKEGKILKIYDIEKTVCDIVKYRNKIGLDIYKEVLKNYLARPERNISKLIKYSKITKTYKVLNQALELILW